MKVNSIVNIRKRLLIALLSITFLFCALVGRLAFVQVVSGKDMRSKAAEQWYRDLPLKAKRGAIYDANGNVIVDSKEIFTVYVRPAAVIDIATVAHTLASALDLDESKLTEKIRTSKVGEITVKKGVEYTVGNELRKLGLDGVYFSVDSARSYPLSGYLSQVIGYTNIDNQGQNGLEGYYDRFLSGTNGTSLTETDNKGVTLDGNVTRYIPAIDGAHLNTTLDVNIQGFVEAAVRDAKTEWKAKATSMLVMDVNTGGIVAMAFSPSYSLDDLPRHDINMLNAYSKNSMIVDVYEPGSTFKIFTTAAAIERGVVNDNTAFFCPGYRVVDGNRIKCWRTIGHGSQHLAEGVKNSCNCVFMDLAQKMGVKNFYASLRDFGFGEKTGVDFFSESSGLVMKESVVKTVDLARIGFGQAIAVTPLQLLSGVCSVVNGGNYNAPHFVDSIVDYSGKTVFTYGNKEKRVLSAATSEKMRALLEAVVSEGSGKKAGVSGYRIGGKTGTAQKYENGAIARGKYISSFVGFAPVDNPKYAALMIVDEPNSYAYYGSIVAAPYVGQVFNKIFQYRNIAPTQIATPPVYADMPLLIGLSPSDAAQELKKLGVNCEIAGEGEKIISTTPAYGEKIEIGDIALLRTEEI